MSASRPLRLHTNAFASPDIDGLLSTLENTDTAESTRDIVAKAIVQVALLGERDRLRVREAALRHLTRRGAMADSL